MSLQGFIEDGSGRGYLARVNSSGAIATAPAAYWETKFLTLETVDTAYNFFAPQSQHFFVITAMLAFADKDVSDASDTVIVVYEASSADTTAVDKALLQFGMGKLTSLPMVPTNIKVNAGKFLNAKTGDDDIHMTIMGYYADDV